MTYSSTFVGMGNMCSGCSCSVETLKADVEFLKTTITELADILKTFTATV
jgi:Fe-S cluster biogenesis protein NfuA